MSKARPHAHIYEKWVRAIKKTLPDAIDRCLLYEYIIAYQIARVYGAEMPNKKDLSTAAIFAITMLEGDLDELCDARRDCIERNRENGAKSTQRDPAGAGRTYTNQYNTNQYNTNQINSNQEEELKDKKMLYFKMGCKLLRMGYVCPRVELDRFIQYVNDKDVKDYNKLVRDWVPQTDRTFLDKEKGARIAEFFEGTTIYNAQLLCDVIDVRYTDNKIIVSPANKQVWEQLQKSVQCNECKKEYINGRTVTHDLRD